jgi:hypothetical protein
MYECLGAAGHTAITVPPTPHFFLFAYLRGVMNPAYSVSHSIALFARMEGGRRGSTPQSDAGCCWLIEVHFKSGHIPLNSLTLGVVAPQSLRAWCELLTALNILCV